MMNSESTERVSISKITKMRIKPEGRKIHKLTEQDIADIKEMYAMNCTLACIAEEIGCSITAVWYHCIPESHRKQYNDKHREIHREWQKKKGGKEIYKNLATRYKKLYEEGLLE